MLVSQVYASATIKCHNPNLLWQAQIVLFVRFLLLYTWSVFALFPALLFHPSNPALDGYEQTRPFLPFFRHLWPSLVPRGQMFIRTQEEPYCACVTCCHVQDMSRICPRTSLTARACATGKTRWVFLLVPGPLWTSPHTVWALASSGLRWSPLSCPSWGYHHGCFVLRCYRRSHPLSARR